MNDFWKETKTQNFVCHTCMHFCNFRCRRHAPGMGGFPAVMPMDNCGDHRLSKETMELMAVEQENNRHMDGILGRALSDEAKPLAESPKRKR